jgi:hypothetical protein
MSVLKGYPSKKRNTRLGNEDLHVTAEPIKKNQHGLTTAVHQFMTDIGTDTVEASSTTDILNLTAHSAKIGDIIKFTSGALDGREVRVMSTDTNTVTLAETLESDPSTLTIEILRNNSPKLDSLGAITISSGPLKFQRDGSDQIVIEDTGTPANNRPLPVKLVDLSGDLNVTTGDLNIQSSHNGANPDSMQIGDGTEILAINASNEAQTRDNDANTTLTSIDGKDFATQTTLALLEAKDFATQTTLAALLVELQLKADLGETQPISAAALPLPTGASTETKQDDIITAIGGIAVGGDATAANQVTEIGHLATIAGDTTSLDGKDFATQTTLAALLTELQLKADLTETQPVSAAALPLPTGAATEATLSSLDGKDFATQTTLAALLTELQAKADLAETQPVSLASQPLPTGAATSAKQDTIISELQRDCTPLARHDYSGGTVTTAAYTQLVASTSSSIEELEIFDSSGQTLFLAVGAAASEVDKLYIIPGGNGKIKARIAAASRISVKAVSADADTGELTINAIG